MTRASPGCSDNHRTLSGTSRGRRHLEPSTPIGYVHSSRSVTSTTPRGTTHRRENGNRLHGYTQNKDAYLKRLRRIEGQVRGIAKMVDEDKYCIDILTQVSAATKALQSVALGLLEEHMGSCVVAAARAGGTEAEVKVKEAADAIERLVRS